MDSVFDFQSRVLKNLEECFSIAGTDSGSCPCIGAAVSGGADSVSLLVSLKKIFPGKIKAVTVNHNIRPAEESCGDADFVESLCNSLGVKCVRYDVMRGEIFSLAQNTKTSLEDAARKIRYEKFSLFMKTEEVPYLCLAHNKNDQVETLIMRFLQGASDFSGIPFVRQNFFRPLLNISRKEIEGYLSLQNINFRTDSTNSDDFILRNRIRNRIVPFLDREFEGWSNAVFSIAEKSRLNEEVFSEATENFISKIDYITEEEKVSFDEEKFFLLPAAIRIRIVFKGIDYVKAVERIPYAFVRDFVTASMMNRKSVSCGGLEFCFSGGRILIQKKRKVATETGFFVIIPKNGRYSVCDFFIDVYDSEEGIIIKTESKEITLKNLRYPFIFRSRQPDDCVRNSDGSFRKASKILDDWKSGKMRDKIPFIQNICTDKKESALEICCIWGSLFGLKDWIVK